MKTYIKPVIEIVEVFEESIIASSLRFSAEKYNGEEILSTRHRNDWGSGWD